MRRPAIALLVLVVVATACASAPPCAATASAQGQDEESSNLRGGKRNGCGERPRNTETDAAPPRPLFVEVPIEDGSGQALNAFHRALHAAEAKRGQARIMFYGASHVAADVYTEVIRQRLQTRFGEGGVGFALTAKPLPHYRNAGLFYENSNGWKGVQVHATEPLEDRYGLAGTYVIATGKRPAKSSFTTRPRSGLTGNANNFELYYLKQPAGGKFRISIDAAHYDIDTESSAPTPAYRHFEAPDAQHRVEVVTRGDGPVQLFGMSIERSEPGVVVDTLGIPGARAANQLLWDAALYREHIERRKPDLLVLAYGTNEAGDEAQPIEEYAADLRKVLIRAHEAAPNASCLLIGPSDRPKSNDAGGYVDRPRTAEIIQMQRQVSSEFRCGFFDLVAFMGGPLSMLRWVKANPPLGATDHVHFTHEGYETLGDVLYDALLTGYTSEPARPAIVLGPQPIQPPGVAVPEEEHVAPPEAEPASAAATSGKRGARTGATNHTAPAAKPAGASVRLKASAILGAAKKSARAAAR